MSDTPEKLPPGNASDTQQGPDPVEVVKAKFVELFELLWFYLSTQFAKARLSFVSAVISAAAAVVALILLIYILATLWSALLQGMIGAIGAATGRIWLGQFIVGLVGLGGLFFGARFGYRRLQKWQLTNLVVKYEQSKSHQRDKFGRDVDDAGPAA